MTILRTGSKGVCGQRGIALFEVLVSVVILAVGLVAVFQPLLTSAGALRDAENRLVANRLMGNQLWLLQEEFERTGRFPEGQINRILTHQDKAFYYGLSYRLLPGMMNLYEVDAVMAWQTGAQRKSIKRSIYAGAL